MEGRVPGGEFLVAGGDERRAVICELGIAGGIKSEELFDGGGVGGVYRILGATDEVLETAEEEDFEASGLGNGGHRGIVTRAQGWGQGQGRAVCGEDDAFDGFVWRVRFKRYEGLTVEGGLRSVQTVAHAWRFRFGQKRSMRKI